MIELKGFYKEPDALAWDGYEDLGCESMVGANFGGKGGGTVQVPTFTPPPAAPAVTEAATQETAVTPEEEMKRKREATREGAKSLQIPLTSGEAGSNTVGTAGKKQMQGSM